MTTISMHKEALDFFRKHPLGTIATINQDGKPECAAVYAKFDDNLTAYFATKTDTRKSQNIARNAAVTFFSADDLSVQCGELIGTASVVEDAAMAARALSDIQGLLADLRQEYWVPPIAQLDAGSYVLYKITPSTVRVVDYSGHKLSTESEPIVNELQF